MKALRYTDTFLTPSQFVADGLVSHGVLKDKCKMLPYTISEDWFNLSNTPIKGRILFVGSAGLRKGIHILGDAANKLKGKGYIPSFTP